MNPNSIKNNPYLFLALLLALLNMGAIFWFFGFQVYDDTPSYLEHINFFKGEAVDIHPWRLLTPLAPVLALPFEFLGQGAGLIVQNVIFYLLAVYLIFRIVEMATLSKKQALWGSVLFFAALPMIYFGLSYMTDMGAWAFCLLSIYLTLLYLKSKNEKLLYYNALLSGLGVLIKINGGLGVLFFPIMIIMRAGDFNLKVKIIKIIKFGLVFILPVLAFNIFSSLVFSYNFLDGYAFNVETYSVGDWREQPGNIYANMTSSGALVYAYAGDFLKSFGIIGLGLALIGLVKELLERNKDRFKIYFALLPFSLAFLIYPPTDSRFSFIAAPLLVLLATYGLAWILKIFAGKWGKILVSLFLAGHVIFNYYFVGVGSYRLILLKLINFFQ